MTLDDLQVMESFCLHDVDILEKFLKYYAHIIYYRKRWFLNFKMTLYDLWGHTSFYKKCASLIFILLAFIEISIKIGSYKNVLKWKKLKSRSFRVCQFQSFFVRCRRTYVLNKQLRRFKRQLLLYSKLKRARTISILENGKINITKIYFAFDCTNIIFAFCIRWGLNNKQ